MSFWDAVTRGLGGLVIGLLTLLLIAWLVARTSRRVLGIQVSASRALLVSLIVSAIIGSLPTLAPFSFETENMTAADAATVTIIGIASLLAVFVMALLVVMVLEVIIPTGSMPTLRAMLTGWGARLRRTGRYLRIMGILGKYGLTAPLRGVINPEQTTAVSLRRAMEEIGVTFVKLGQMLSTRSDLLPAGFINELSKLTIDAEPQDYRVVRTVLQDELGGRLERLQIDPAPLAAASVAQVHAAVLDADRSVVVKVQRAGAAEQVKTDLQILERLGRTMARNAPWARQIGVVEIVDGFAQSVRDELNYSTEIDNMSALRPGLAAGGVRVPQVYDELSTDRVIVMERFDGVPLARAAEVVQELPNQVRRESADTLLRAVLGQILDQGVFHADLHSGNVVIWPDGEVGLLDFGSVGRLDASARRNLALLLWAVDADDPGLATDAVLELLDHDDNLDERGLERAMGVLITRVRGRATGGSLAFFQAVLKVVLQQGMAVPSNITLALRSLGSLEGTLKILNPRLDLIAAARNLSRDVVGDISSEGVRKQLSNQAVRALPLLTQLPRRLNRITEDLQNGRFTSHIRIVSHPDDRDFLTGLANQIVVAMLSGFAVVGAILLLSSSGGPVLYAFRVYDILGFLLGFAGLVLALRSVAMVFGRRT
ncbi:MAG: AarF/UbiB family protein [Brooklawnia sp.]|uniref:ABC1 kinase family protein n=1 Tax=Brooklawnia sp. TaxID=2699740 RepID=UPI003C71D4E6